MVIVVAVLLLKRIAAAKVETLFDAGVAVTLPAASHINPVPVPRLPVK
jgi:hypothetical protein